MPTMKTRKHAPGPKKVDHGLTEAEREARFAKVAALARKRSGGKHAVGTQHGPSELKSVQARLLGIAKRAARVRPGS
jgi:hypothetical protein